MDKKTIQVLNKSGKGLVDFEQHEHIRLECSKCGRTIGVVKGNPHKPLKNEKPIVCDWCKSEKKPEEGYYNIPLPAPPIVDIGS